ncbi:MAG: hypothetical protein EOP04_18580, partial [Proteobacteria bacterium]
IHNVSGGVRGDVNIIENYARTMRKFNDTIVNFYANLTGKSTKQVSDWMDAETWFTGTEAVNHGFVKNSTEEVSFTNSISPELFPYKNLSALNLYNSFVKAPGNENDDENFNLNTDMNKLIEAFVNKLKELGVITDSADQQSTAPMTADAMTNAMTEAFKDFDIPTMVNTAVADMFKDGLPEPLANALSTSMTTVVDEKLKNYATSESVKDLQTNLKEVEKNVANNTGGAQPKKKESSPANAEDKYEHDGVSWGNQDAE